MAFLCVEHRWNKIIIVLKGDWYHCLDGRNSESCALANLGRPKRVQEIRFLVLPDPHVLMQPNNELENLCKTYNRKV